MWIRYYQVMTSDGISNDSTFLEHHVNNMHHHQAEITMKRIIESPLIKWLSEPIIFILNANEWKAYGKRFSSEWLKACGRVPRKTRSSSYIIFQESLVSSFIASRRFPCPMIYTGSPVVSITVYRGNWSLFISLCSLVSNILQGKDPRTPIWMRFLWLDTVMSGPTSEKVFFPPNWYRWEG